MKFFEATHIYPHPWPTITKATFQKYKYSDNTHLAHVKAVDVLDRSLDPATGILRTERLITCEQNAPRFITALLGGDTKTYIHEISYVDVGKKELVARSRNMTGSAFMVCEEEVVYRPVNEDNMKTLFTQSAQITAFLNFSKLSQAVEEFCIKRFHDNAERGRQGLEQVVDRILKEGRDLGRDIVVTAEELFHNLERPTTSDASTTPSQPFSSAANIPSTSSSTAL